MSGSSYSYSVRRLAEGIGELLEHQEGNRARSELRRYLGNPLGFFEEVLDVDLTPPQVELVQAILDNPQVVCRGCHGSGKDFTVACIALYWVFAVGGLVLLTGPTERQVKEILMRREVRRLFKGKRLPGDLFEMALRIEDDERCGILAFTASDTDRFTGHHAPAVLIAITEGQGVEAEIYEAAQRVLTGEMSRLVVVGNANRPIGRFYEIHRSSQWVKVKISAFDHPNVQAGREIIPGAVTLQWVESIAKEHGKESSFYRAAVLAEFPEDADESLVQRSWLEHSAERWSQGRADANSALVFSVDPARFGSDKTALAICQGRRLLEMNLWAKRDTMETVGKLLDHLDRFRVRQALLDASAAPSAFSPPAPASVIIDEVGLGSGVVDRLRELGYKVRSFNGGSAAKGKDSDRFHNRRAEAFWTLRKLLEQGRVDLPYDPELWEELQATRWMTTSAGRIQIAPKDDIKSQINRSPDRADAVAMAFWQDLVSKPALPRIPSVSYWTG